MYVTTPEGLAIGGGAIAISLMDTLIDKGILSKDDARQVLKNALTVIGVHVTSNSGKAAASAINVVLETRFPQGN